MMINPMLRTFREKRTRDLRAPDVIGELFMLLMLVVIGVGAGTGSALVVALGATAFVISAGGTLWSKMSLAEVAYDAVPSDSHAFVGDEIEIVMTLENRKPLPIPWVQVIEFLPTGLTPLSDDSIKRREHTRVEARRSRLRVWRAMSACVSGTRFGRIIVVTTRLVRRSCEAGIFSGCSGRLGGTRGHRTV